MDNIQGYQFTLNYDGLTLLNFEKGLADAANFNFSNQAKGYLTTSWHQTRTKSTEISTSLFLWTFETNSVELLTNEGNFQLTI